MDKKDAIDILIAVACCTNAELTCLDCPLYREHRICRQWDDDKVVKAVMLLKGNGENNEIN